MRHAVIGMALGALLMTSPALADPVRAGTSGADGLGAGMAFTLEDLTPGLSFSASWLNDPAPTVRMTVLDTVGASQGPIPGFTPPGQSVRGPGNNAAGTNGIGLALGRNRVTPSEVDVSGSFDSPGTSALANIVPTAAGPQVTFGPLQTPSPGPIRIGNAEAPIATPEPASMLLIGTGLAGLAAYRRRRSKQAAEA